MRSHSKSKTKNSKNFPIETQESLIDFMNEVDLSSFKFLPFFFANKLTNEDRHSDIVKIFTVC